MADVNLLLVSPDFIQSDYCYGKEMQQAIDRHSAKEAKVIPILLRSVDWTDTPFKHLQVLPTNARPITLWSDYDAAFEDVARGIRRVVNDLLMKQDHDSYQLDTSTSGVISHTLTTSSWQSGISIFHFIPRKKYFFSLILFSILFSFLPLLIIAGIIFQLLFLSPPSQGGLTPTPTHVTISYGPPLYTLNIQNTDPSLNNATRHLQNVFNAVYPQLVNRLARASASTNVVTLILASDLPSPAIAGGTIVVFSSDWIRQHPNDVGLFTHELALLVQGYPPGAPNWFSDGMADYARDVYGPADDDWSLSNTVQSQDRYTQGGGVAARFLLWLEQYTRLDIVDQLNHALQTKQPFLSTFQRLTHHTVDELWNQYKGYPVI